MCLLLCDLLEFIAFAAAAVARLELELADTRDGRLPREVCQRVVEVTTRADRYLIKIALVVGFLSLLAPAPKTTSDKHKKDLREVLLKVLGAVAVVLVVPSTDVRTGQNQNTRGGGQRWR